MKACLTFAILAVLMATAYPAFGCDESAFGLHLATWHIDVNQDRYNDATVGAYAMCNGWTAGTLRNSIDHQSFYAGYTAQKKEFALTMGVISGYGRPVPLLVASVKLGAMRVGLFPRYQSSPAGIHFMLEF